MAMLVWAHIISEVKIVEESAHEHTIRDYTLKHALSNSSTARNFEAWKVDDKAVVVCLQTPDTELGILLARRGPCQRLTLHGFVHGFSRHDIDSQDTHFFRKCVSFFRFLFKFENGRDCCFAPKNVYEVALKSKKDVDVSVSFLT